MACSGGDAVKVLDVVGPGEVAAMFNVHPVTVSRWQKEGVLPEPDRALLQGPVWRRATIVAWANETGRELHYE